MTRDWKGELGSNKKQKMKELHEKYRVKKKGLKTVIEELKQRMVQRFERGRERERETERDRERQRERVNHEYLQEIVIISVAKIRKQCRKIGKPQGEMILKDIGPTRNLSSQHKHIFSQVNRTLMGEDDLPEWMTHGHIVLCQKD